MNPTSSISLRSDTWWPRDLVPSVAWPGTTERVRLGDAATVRSVSSHADRSIPTVEPTDVDEVSGDVLVRSIASADIVVFGDDVQSGDVLVPERNLGPCILVSDDARGLAFRGFLIVRSAPGLISPKWLWLLLSSTSGVHARASLLEDSHTELLTPLALANLVIPCPKHAIPAALPKSNIETSPTLRSAWALRDLRHYTSWIVDPLQRHEVQRLGDLGVIWAGHVDIRNCYGTRAPGRLPVMTTRLVRGLKEPSQLWAVGGAPTTDLTVVITRNEPFRVKRAHAGMLLAKDLLAIEVGGDVVTLDSQRHSARIQFADALVATLTAKDGRDALMSAARGVTVQHLS